MTFTQILGTAPDRGTFAAAGPGTICGLNRLSGRRVDFDLDQGRALLEIREVYRLVREALPHIALDFSDTANILCEFSKYAKVRDGTGHMRANYRPAA